ncbi:peptidoglycan-binding protein [Metabacillus iocasae]|uniref:Peptidoglycan hydrolase-like protein with peptidoglycan-binding domain n=1 Tax=Priestia iocasae TaxID=2291674 RepID=A0ABS2QXF7_9BACI|nr:peptidoglycan-binding protein [Metabacillus iocasae]MBM7703863.1 peptidoglycan hydrolase-like protein with peptidoglycan-binding domain [Metabacillus iocasae]
MKKLIYSIALCGSLTVVPTISEASLGDITLRQGMNHSDVKALQNVLKEKGQFNYHTTTTYFGSITKSAVMNFQRANGLSADGIVGPNTYRALLQNSSQASKSSSSASLSRTLRVGSTGADVQKLQQLLKNKGHFSGNTTQYFGSMTKNAVMSFQRANGLSVDGIAGAATFRALQGSSSTSASSTAVSSKVLRQGMSGSAVTSVQKILINKGYLKANATGYFGSQTRSAVASFQRANGLAADGIVGSATQRKLSSNTSKSAVGGVSTESAASQLISYGKRFMGTPYVWGGSAPGGFDCSGFLNYVFRNGAGVNISRTVASIYQQGTHVSNPQVGDLVFFETYKPGASHAGIYLGNGQFLHSSSSKGVGIDSLSNSYWSKRYLGAKRYL